MRGTPAAGRLDAVTGVPSPLPPARRRTATALRVARGAPVVLLPWVWFAIRDRWAPLDALASVLPVIAGLAVIALVVVALWRRRALHAAVAASILALVAVTSIGPRMPIDTPAPAAGIRIASSNVADKNRSIQEAAKTLGGLDVDVIVTVEMGDDFWRQFAAVAVDRFPYTAAVGEVGVRSRWPVDLLRTPSPVAGGRLIRVRIDAPGAPFILYAVHALNPSHEFTFGQQQGFVGRLIRAAAIETEPVVIAGDLNLSDRTTGYRTLSSKFRDAMRDGGLAGSTFEDGLWATLFLRIDHIFVPRDWCAAGPGRFGVPGSDHRGVTATIGPCP